MRGVPRDSLTLATKRKAAQSPAAGVLLSSALYFSLSLDPWVQIFSYLARGHQTAKRIVRHFATRKTTGYTDILLHRIKLTLRTCPVGQRLPQTPGDT